MRTIVSLFIALTALLSHAADSLVTVTVTVTNVPAAGSSLTINGDTRTWQSSVSVPASQVTISTNGAAASATNLYAHAAIYGFAGPLVIGRTSSNAVTFRGQFNQSMAASVSAGWAALSYSTNQITNMVGVRVPASAEAQSVRRFVADELVRTISENALTNVFDAAARALTNYLNLVSAQTVLGAKSFTNRAGLWSGTVSNALIIGGLIEYDVPASGLHFHAPTSDRVTSIRADVFGRPTLYATAEDPASMDIYQANPAAGNLLTYDLATNRFAAKALPNAFLAAQTFAAGVSISGESTNSGTIRGGTVSNATVVASTFSGTIGTLFGGSISNSQLNGTVGLLSGGTITGAVFHGSLGLVSGGTFTAGMLSNSTVSGATMRGTTTIDGTTKLPPNTLASLANGVNAGVDLGDYTWVKLTAGPTAAFSIAGFAGGSSGRVVWVYNATGQNMTISNQSGTEPTASNRIVTMTGSDVVTTGNGAIQLIYDSAAARWLLVSADL